jgi:cytochrome P450
MSVLPIGVTESRSGDTFSTRISTHAPDRSGRHNAIKPLPNMKRAPFSPPAPQALYFDSEVGAWIVSRHHEVLAVLRSPAMSQAKPPQKTNCSSELSAAALKPAFDATHHARRQHILDNLRSRFGEWHKTIGSFASELLSQLPLDTPLDLVTAFLQPWCLRSALLLAETPEEHGRYLTDLVCCLSRRDAQPDDPAANSDAKKANQELDRFFADYRGPARKSIFLGMAQTVPAFLASAWCALFQNPNEWIKLRTNPEAMTTSIEELLRYASPVHTLFRRAEQEFHLCGRTISQGSRLVLRLDSANRDPELFSDPNRLNVMRRVPSHFSLGTGLNSCVGASAVRASIATATRSLLERSSSPKLSGHVEWLCGTMLLWPSSLPAVLSTADE